jgi:4-hydroxybenzoate polyprenyltransferase/phosphoserine phosphatase
MPHPLVVDLDGTLVRTDLLVEAALCYSKEGWLSFARLPLWLLRGKSVLKERLADAVRLDVSRLPYNEAVLSLIEDARRNGRQVVLATASPRPFADDVARHLGVFDQVLATEGDVNLKASRKRDRLVGAFGEKGFDYVGDSRADLTVWASAGHAYLVDPAAGVARAARRQGNVSAVISSGGGRLKAFTRALRPYQWLKNLLIFIPLLAAHRFTDHSVVAGAITGFILFCVTASSGYLFNDLLDLDHDRYHNRKKHRPLASGSLPILSGLVAAPLMLLAAMSTSLWVMPSSFSVALGAYAFLTVSYSRYLKKLAGLDTIALAALYTLRVIAGAFACRLVPTFWILAFSMFLFLSLAMVKRYSELYDARSKGSTAQAKGRGYFPGDLEVVSSLGTAAGYLSVLVLALYIQDGRTVRMYATHELIWLSLPILLFWISRIWLLAHRGQMHDDPLLFAVTDRASLIAGTVFASVFVLAMIR